MNGTHERYSGPEIERVTRSGGDAEWRSMADAIAADWARDSQTLADVLNDSGVRRWARRYLLNRLPRQHAQVLARHLLDWKDDFQTGQRDRSASYLIEFLSLDTVQSNLHWLAGTNAAGAVWDRLAQEGTEAVDAAAHHVLSHGDVAARETTLHLLALDPYGPQHLGREQQNELLRVALGDEDPEIRGLAAEVIAADMPGLLLERQDTAPLDAGERVRMAFWRVALISQPERARDDAAELVLDASKPHEARRSALLALGEHLPTREMSMVLQALLRGDDEVLAEDAAQLMWRHHRTPDIANAAAESQFESVRDLAERLLHPERGSPAAGGSRPGDPTRTTEIFDQISSTGEWRGPEPGEHDT